MEENYLNKPHELRCTWCGAIYDNCDGQECEHTGKQNGTCDVECFMGRREHGSRIDLDVRDTQPYKYWRNL